MSITEPIDWPLIRTLADYSAKAYSQSTVTDARTKASALVLAHGGNIYVTYCGSKSPEDFFQDAKFEMRPLGGRGIKVHRGFMEDYEALSLPVITQVKTWLDLMPAAKVFIGGHSLGGGESILCARDFAELKLPLERVITFGQPRVGNAAFREFYNNFKMADGRTLGEITFHVINPADPVPLVPPLLFGYRDEGNEIYLSRSGPQLNPSIGLQIFGDLLGAFDSWRRGRLAFVPNHFIAAYQERMQSL